MTRAELITIVHKRLGTLATEIGFLADEASYGNAVDYALRSLRGDTVIDSVAVEEYNELIDLTEQAAYRELRNRYSLYVDIELGPRKEKFSQALKALDKLIQPGPMVTRDAEYEFTDFTLYSGGVSWPIDWWLRNYETWELLT